MSCAGSRDALRSAETQEIRDALRSVRIELLVPDVLSRDADDAAHAAVLASILADWRGPDEERHFGVASSDRTTLVRRVQDWSALLLAQPDLRRYDLAELARVISRIGDVALLPALMAMWGQGSHPANRRTRRTGDQPLWSARQ